MSERPVGESRVIELETQLAHLWRLFEQLNQVVTTEALRADRLERKVQALQHQLSEVKTKQADDPGDPLDEKPPHY